MFKKDISFTQQEKAQLFTLDAKAFFQESARNDNYTQSYINNFKFVVENLKKDYIKKSEVNSGRPYEVNKTKLKENPNFLLASYARKFFEQNKKQIENSSSFEALSNTLTELTNKL